jgi:hypothetical protein
VAVVMALGCASGLAGFSSVRASGDIVVVEPVVENFSRVRTGHGCRLTVVPSNEHSVVVRIDDNVRGDLEVNVDDSTLRIQLASGRNYRNLHCEVEIAMPDIDGVRLSGGARGNVSDFDLDHAFEARMSGGSRLEGTFTAAHLDVTVSGGATADLSGSSDSASLRGSGGGRITLADWRTASADVTFSGGSRGSIDVRDDLTGRVSGGGSISYVDAPRNVDVSRSGGGRVGQQ